MKTLYLFIILIAILATSCKKDDIANESEFNKSYKTWLSYKSSVNNSYTYTVSSGSWTGYGSQTKIGVNNGEIISRDFIATMPRRDSSHKIDTVERWHEDKAHINTHGINAAGLFTLDDIYQKARTVWLKADAKKNDIFFEVKNNGMISTCGFVPDGCQDDCFNGVTITSITAP